MSEAYIFESLLFDYSDIALIKLPTPIVFNEYIKSIPLACPDRYLLGSPVVAVGNGITNTDRVARILQYAHLRVSGQEENVIFAEGLSKESTKSGDSGNQNVQTVFYFSFY